VSSAATPVIVPRSVAIVGASEDPKKRGNQVAQALLTTGFPGPIFAVNPRARSVLGLPTFPSVAAITEPVDLALIATPASTLSSVLKDCGEKGVRGAVVIAGGFAEAGLAGAEAQAELSALARHYGVRFLGPNTNGLFRSSPPVNLLGARDIPAGHTAVVSQSGNVFLSLLTEAQERATGGFSTYVGLGNQGDLEFADFLDFLAEDDVTKSVILYAEGINDGRRFLHSVYEVARRKPVVVMKSGRTEVGRAAVKSHSASLAGSSEVWDGALHQAGAVAVHRLDELMRVSTLLESTPPLAHRGVAVISDGGGHAAIAADALSRSGLALPRLDPRTEDALRALLPAGAATRNPIDVAGGTDSDPGVLADVADLVAADPGVAGIMIVGIFGGYALRFAAELQETEVVAARRIAEVQTVGGLPTVVQTAYADHEAEAIAELRGAGVSVDTSIEVTALGLAALAARSEFLQAEPPHFDGNSPLAPTGVEYLLGEPDGRELLREFGLGGSDWGVVENAAAAGRFAAELGQRVAMKIVSPDIVHKSDVGGVRLGIDPSEAPAVYGELVAEVGANAPDARLDGVFISPMAPIGLELFAGAHWTDAVGPVVGLGLGGRAVEMAGAIDFRAAPLTRHDADRLVANLEELAKHDAARGTKMLTARDALIALLLAISAAISSGKVVSIDLNPVIAHPGGLEVVDARVVIAGGASLTSERRNDD
jgi:acyl-CoA synthetase (NDP forming)